MAGAAIVEKSTEPPPKKLKIESASNAASLLPSVFPQETKALSWNAICSPTSVAVLFTKTKAQKQPKYLPTSG